MPEFLYNIGAKLNISMMAADASISSIDVPEGTPGIEDTTPKKKQYCKQDAGIGIVVNRKTNGDDDIIYQLAVIEGRFDPHRNELGELWVNEFELSPIEYPLRPLVDEEL
jgi:hypothetical protein